MPIAPQGKFDQVIIDAYVSAELNSGRPTGPDQALYYSDEVEYKYPASRVDKSKGRDLGSCVYMDVGLWAGGGPSESTKTYNYSRHREFGLVAGNVAVLCQYPDPKIAKQSFRASYGRVNDEFKDSLYFKNRIKNLLEHLSTDKQLGHVQVIKAMISSDTARVGIDLKKEDNQKTYIFLGDLHAPVVTELKRTFLLPDLEAEIMLNAPRIKTVNRCGRLPRSFYRQTFPKNSLGMPPFAGNPTLNKLQQVIAGKTLDMIGLKKWFDSIWNLQPRMTDFYGPPPRRKQLEVEILQKSAEFFMSSQEAVEWFHQYHGQGRKGADIFEDAGSDLLRWLNLIKTYQPNDQKERVCLVQVGDMYDFWMGFLCGFTARREDNTLFCPGAQRFAEFWMQETQRSSKGMHTGDGGSGDAISALENLESKFVTKRFIYGNHDNYCSTLSSRSRALDVPGLLYADHGHASDEFNCHEDARLGWLITQLVFHHPGARDVEGPASALFAKIKMSIGERLARMAYGADVCYENKYLIYVMGHTHRATMKKIKYKVK